MHSIPYISGVLYGKHMNIVERPKIDVAKTVILYFTFVFAAIVLTLVLRTVSLTWVHNVRPKGASPLILLRGSVRVALIIGPIQTVILLLGILCCTRRRREKRLRYVVFTTIVLCFLNLFIRPITIWTDCNTTMFFSMVIGFVPVAIFVSYICLLGRGSEADAIQHGGSVDAAAHRD